jgi:hypothetical protein
VHRVERAQSQITEAFTLDSESSPLARLRKELMGNAAQMSESFAEFQKKMEVEIAKWNATRNANAKTTAHGNEFEAALLRWLERRAHESGDLFEEVGSTTGLVKNCKVGDAVVELGPEHRAAGARIAIEAKEDASYRLPKAREEIESARKNRGAEVGLFVLSSRTTPDGWERFRVIGSDLFISWDVDDPASDVFLEAALAVARAHCTRARQGAQSENDFDAFDRSIRAVEKQVDGLEEILTSAGTIEGGVARIRKRAELLKDNLERAVKTLDKCCDAARLELGDETG